MGEFPIGKLMIDAADAVSGTIALKGRRRVVFVTIDDVDKYYHDPNTKQLGVITAAFNKAAAGTAALTNERVYLDKVDAGFLASRDIFCLFLAGSFPEWHNAATDKKWAAELKRFGEVMKATKVPTLAVCGSHQLLAVAYAGWGALGHMALVSKGEVPVVIEDEHKHVAAGKGADLIPHPRVGEVGSFAFDATAIAKGDPLLAGITPPYRFMEHHHDQVLNNRRSTLFSSLLQPSATAMPIQREDTPALGVDRCQMQLLRLDSDEKLLYTMQFHPELACSQVFSETTVKQVFSHKYKDEKGKEVEVSKADPADKEWAKTDEDAQKLVHNFYRLARDYWKKHP